MLMHAAPYGRPASTGLVIGGTNLQNILIVKYYAVYRHPTGAERQAAAPTRI